MKIPKLSELPEVGQGVDWARGLGTYQSTISRAYQSGKLRGSKVGRKTVLFTRQDIFEWLGLEILVDPAPTAPAPRPIERIVARAPVIPRQATASGSQKK